MAKRMKKILIISTSLLFFCLAPVYADAPLVDQTELFPNQTHKDTTKFITHVINSIHYRKKPIDDELSSAIFDTYLKGLDPNRSFFLQTDIDSFSKKYRYQLDQALLRLNLAPAFNIFKSYRTRVEQRIEYATSELQNNFNFDLDEDYAFDRRELDWGKDVTELNTIWRKRVKNDMLNLLLTGKEESTAKDILKKRYQRMKTSTFQLEANDIFQLFINAYTTLIEPHTNYFSPRASENFDISMRLSLEGIGAVLMNENDYTLIQRIIPGGPADLSKKLHGKDKIIGVGQGHNGEIIDVVGWRLGDVVELIRGPKDTVLRLEIIPGKTGNGDLSQLIMLTRNKIKLEESAAKSEIIILPETNQRIGVIDIPTFYVDFGAQAKGEENFRSTSKDVKKLIGELVQQDIAGIVVDLRSNGGGSLSEALATTGLFIKSGPVVQTKNSSGGVRVNNDPDTSLVYSGPLAVLVDRNSASASEIFAGAIQDYQRGTIIGEPTYGKGTVQTIIDLNNLAKNSQHDHGKLKTTIQQFFRISGGSNQNKGVIPDIVFPTAIDTEEHGERALENALPWDQIEPTEYIKLSAPIKLYGKVRMLHEERVRTDKAFQLLLKQLTLVKKNKDKQVISLNKVTRKAEREELLTAKHELENELRIAQGLEPLERQAESLENDTADDDADEPYDILLREATHILGNLIALVSDNRTTMMKASKNKMAVPHEKQTLGVQ